MSGGLGPCPPLRGLCSFHFPVRLAHRPRLLQSQSCRPGLSLTVWYFGVVVVVVVVLGVVVLFVCFIVCVCVCGVCVWCVGWWW